MNEFGEPNMGNPSVRFDEGRARVGHWPCASQSDLPAYSTILKHFILCNFKPAYTSLFCKMEI